MHRQRECEAGTHVTRRGIYHGGAEISLNETEMILGRVRSWTRFKARQGRERDQSGTSQRCVERPTRDQEPACGLAANQHRQDHQAEKDRCRERGSKRIRPRRSTKTHIPKASTRNPRRASSPLRDHTGGARVRE